MSTSSISVSKTVAQKDKQNVIKRYCPYPKHAYLGSNQQLPKCTEDQLNKSKSCLY